MYQVSRHVDPSEPKSDRVGSFYDLLLFLFVFSCYFVFILFLLPRIIQTLANGEGFHATFSRCLPNFTEFCKGFTEFYRVLQGFYRILSCFIEFYKGFTNLPSFTGFLISNTVTSLDPFFCEVHHFAKKNGYRVFHWVSASLLRAFPCERNDILEIRWTIAIQFLISNTVTSLDPFFCEVHHFAKKKWLPSFPLGECESSSRFSMRKERHFGDSLDHCNSVQEKQTKKRESQESRSAAITTDRFGFSFK